MLRAASTALIASVREHGRFERMICGDVSQFYNSPFQDREFR